MKFERKTPLGTFNRNSQVRTDKIATLKKAVADGTYEIRPDDTAGKILKNLLIQCALMPSAGEYAVGRDKQKIIP